MWFSNKNSEMTHDDNSVLLSETETLRQSVLRASMPSPVEAVALREVERLTKTNSSVSEYTIGVNYVEYLTSLPWNAMTGDNLDIERASRILDEKHYGLDDVKERILEYLAVRKLRLSSQARILLVDDDAIACRNMAHILVKDGYEVVTANSGVDGLHLLNRSHFDLVVTDFKMENMDGMELLEKTKAIDPTIIVIMVSGYASTPKAVEAIKKGSYHFLAKPLQIEELKKTIQTALTEKKTQFFSKGPILCFVGPPGTGKTSLQRSIARCLGRKFIRISLAGIKDEAEIRGHRRSYIGAMPGRIIQEIRRVQTRNPLIMLDEIDKISQEAKGDPASALLEVLDPTQNSHFTDHYLDLPFDLSRVMFIATANTLDAIPGPLRDRLEVLSLSGYIEEEKEKIASQFLIPTEKEEAGIHSGALVFSPESVQKVIREYTREPGLRELQRQIAAICRKTARGIVANEYGDSRVEITPMLVEKFLGPRKYFFEVATGKARVGVATGLALTEAGGQIIFIEASIMKGSEQLILTGSLGTVMKESAQAALSYLRSNAHLFAIQDDFFTGHDIHIHIPAGAIPKDGPSAGLPIAIALLSLLTGRPVRRDIAFTGELTLSGRLLPVGGVKGKMLAAKRAGIKKVVIPELNLGEVHNFPPAICDNLAIISVQGIDEIVDTALLKEGEDDEMAMV